MENKNCESKSAVVIMLDVDCWMWINWFSYYFDDKLEWKGTIYPNGWLYVMSLA